uniref:Uncharacterized protein n=1 Tax=Arundo donax TaxID=35708 RepID=A0A0A9EIL8_ARUDO
MEGIMTRHSSKRKYMSNSTVANFTSAFISIPHYFVKL